MNPTRPCPRCGRQVISTIAFCPACGERIAPQSKSISLKLVLGALAVFAGLLWVVAISSQTQRGTMPTPAPQAQLLASSALTPAAPVAQTLELTSAQHLSEARRALADGYKPNKDPQKTSWGEVAAARWHLKSIGQGAPEYREAQELLKEVAKRERQELAAKAAAEAQATRASDEPAGEAGEGSSAATTTTPAPPAKQAAQSTAGETSVQPTSPGGSSSDDYYTNAYGKRVRRPTFSESGPPAGASAQCRDGSYSFSQSRRGTCSHHGGVARWLP
jgi:hypothetical protein